MGFLPTTVKEMKALGWDYVDIILFTGDAYIDHPSFGAAVVSRLFEAEGYRVAVVPQPNWRDDLRDFKKLGVPRLCFCVSAGAMDSMVNHYTANIRLRSNDAYTAGGAAGFRPDYTVTTYTKILKSLFPDTPVLIGGIEASLRRVTHYDYWKNTLMPSILIDSGADFLLYGMGEQVVREVAKSMHSGFNPKRIRGIRQVAFVADKEYVERLDRSKTIFLNSFERCKADKHAFGQNFVTVETESNLLRAENILVEPTGDKFVVINPMNAALTTEQIDYAFDLPYMRAPHPRYNGRGDIPAWMMIRHSVNIHRGCFGGCSFCTISAHQGKFISSRSEASVLREVEAVVAMPDFRGTITDVGGPSANMYRLGGKKTELCAKCRRPSCLHPKPCPNLNRDHRPLIDLYRKVRAVKGVKHAYIGSGIRYDLFENNDYLREVVLHHTSGRLKVAPEHTEDGVLNLMRKPSFTLFEALNRDFNRICRENNLRYQLIPYFISSHPGCHERDMKALSVKVLGKLHFT
ncbi:MAG: YgiQ family radical SAM protein, partial [Alistipes sp.]|nr:YgiQ family radical SAM protein [Alistipes sp.]